MKTTQVLDDLDIKRAICEYANIDYNDVIESNITFKIDDNELDITHIKQVTIVKY